MSADLESRSTGAFLTIVYQSFLGGRSTQGVSWRLFLHGFLIVISLGTLVVPLKEQNDMVKKKSQRSASKPSKKKNSEPWYKDGLKFTCTGCGDCCTGAPGYVWVNKAEVEKMAEVVGLNVEKFQDDYTRKVGIRRTLKEFSNGDCVFFDNESRKCQVYDARPRQCKTWPFWDSNLKSEEAWEETCNECPGSGTGKLHQLADIESQRGVMKI